MTLASSMASTSRRGSSCGIILPAASKEIEFVVPPSVSPYSSNRQLNPHPSHGQPMGGGRLTPNYMPSTNQKNSSEDADGQGTTAAAAFVNKGWNKLQELCISSTSLNLDGSRKSSRSASISVSTLGLNHASSSNNLAPRMNQERRASTNSIYLVPGGKRSRSHSKSSIHNYGSFTPPSNSAPGSRKNSKPNILIIEPALEVQGLAYYGGLDPSLYKDDLGLETKEAETFPDNHLGRIYFNIQFDPLTEALSVLIKRIRNLPKSTKESGNTNKTYVKICLLPDERSERRCSPSSERFADLNPVFNESFIMQASPKTLFTRSLRLLVNNIDNNRKHHVIGQSLIEFDTLEEKDKCLLEKGGKINLTVDLQKYVKVCEADAPEILLSICYNASISRLTVNVVECKNLKPESGNPPDTFIKVQLMHQTKEIKRKKTSIVKKSLTPQYQESFNFRIEEEELDQSALRVTCMHHLPFLEKDRQIGNTVLGSFMFARGSGAKHWEDIKQKQKQHIQQWHKLASEGDSNAKGGGSMMVGSSGGGGKNNKKLRHQDSM